MRLTYTQESDFRRERDFGQKISATFEFIGAHWRPLGRVLLYLVVPAALLQGILSSIMQIQLQESSQALLRQDGSTVVQTQLAMFSNLAGSPFYWLNTVIGTLLVSLIVLSIYGYLVLCLRRTPAEGEVTPAEVWALIRGQLLGTFFSLWGISLIVLLGLALLFFPGAYLGVALSLFFIVRMVEGTGFGRTLSRCLSLTKGKWWSTFGLVLLMMVVVYVFMLGIAVIGLILGGARGLVQAVASQSPVFTIVVSALTTVITLLVYPPMLLALAFQYFNLVERKEGLGLRLMVDGLGQAAAPQVSSAGYRPDEEGEY